MSNAVFSAPLNELRAFSCSIPSAIHESLDGYAEFRTFHLVVRLALRQVDWLVLSDLQTDSTHPRPY